MGFGIMETTRRRKIAYLRSKLEDLRLFLTEMSPLTNCHLVDFIINDEWELLSSGLQKDLLNVPKDESNLIISDSFLTSERWKRFPHLCNFIKQANSFKLGICEEINVLFPALVSGQNENIKDAVINWHISSKKRHEVQSMASLISSLSNKFSINLIVDVGSGKGYLSSYLALFHSLNVLAIDSCDRKSKSAVIRNRKLSNMCAKWIEKSNCEKCLCSQSDDHKQVITNHHTAMSIQTNYFDSKFVSVTKQIDLQTDLQNIITNSYDKVMQHNDSDTETNKKPNKNSKYSTFLCGLHTCGNLSCTLIQQFTICNTVQVLCNISCCYNLLVEKYDSNSGENLESGFPLSSQLNDLKFVLGHNARMLASQSQERINKKTSIEDVHRCLYYRAVFQVILSKHLLEHSLSNFHVGKLSKKCNSFKEYVHKALKKLSLEHINIDSKELDSYLDVYSAEENKLKLFNLLRILLAPCIERLILLDRLVYLWEQDCTAEAHLVCLFDPLISPRCYCLIAVKK